MRSLLAASGAAMLAGTTTSALANQPEFAAEAGVRHLSWQDDLGDSAIQSVAEISAAASWGRFEAAAATGYAVTEFSSDVDAFNGDLSTPLDTQISVGWIPGRTSVAGFPVLFSLSSDINLPTGTSALAGREKNVALDPLLAIYDRYGEGLNIGVTGLASIEFNRHFALAAGLSHVVNGAYEPDADQPDLELDPGNVTAVNVEAVWSQPGLFVRAGAQVAETGVLTRDGVDFYDRGASIQIDASLHAKLSQRGSVTVAASFATRAEDKIFDEIANDLVEEDERRAGDVWSATALYAHQINPRWSLRLDADYVNVTSSEFDDDAFEYLPERERWRIGPGATYALGLATSLDASIKYFHWTDKGSALLIPLDAEGVTATLTLGRTW